VSPFDSMAVPVELVQARVLAGAFVVFELFITTGSS